MAQGRKIIDWKYDDMAKGMSTSDDMIDGGFSPLTDAINLIAVSGIAHAPTAPTDKSTGLTGSIIASCEDPTGSYQRVFVSSDVPAQDGRFYSSSSGTLTQRGSTDSSHDYVQGRTDMIAFANEVYITNATTIVRWSAIGGANTFNTSFFGFIDGIAPHPALVYESNAFYGDGRYLLRQTAAGVSPEVILTLSAGQKIVALGIDSGSGKMLISVVGQFNLSDTFNSQARVLYYDGFSQKASKVVLVEEMITAFPTSEGAVYAAYGKNLGYWNGAGVSFLRSFNIDYVNTELMYKQHFTNIGSTLYFIEKNRIIAHGSVRQGGDKVFYPAFRNNISGSISENLTHITNLGQGVLGLSFPTDKFYTWSTTAVDASNTQILYSNPYLLEEYNEGVWLRRVKIYWKNSVPNNADPGSIFFFNEEGFMQEFYDLKNTSGAASAVKTISFGSGTGVRVQQIQFRPTLDSGNYGIRRIVIYGDPANTP